MNDDLGLFGDADDERRRGRPVRIAARTRTKRRLTWFTTGVVVAAIGLLAWFGVGQLLGIAGFADYSGDGSGGVLIEVQDGQSQRQIAATMADSGVVASSRAFTAAGQNNDKVMAVQPGYYVMHKKMSGTAAVDLITDPKSRVGDLQIRPGSRLDDTKMPDGKIAKGIISQLAEASCAELDGKSTCVSATKLRDVVKSSDLASLGVPDWAAKSAAKVDVKHRLEGLVAPGLYEVKPGSPPEQLLKDVLTTSAAKLSAEGLPDAAQSTGMSPYDLLKVASLVQNEGIETDFGKVSRVIANRIEHKQRLEFDSTVNYVLDRPGIRTTPADRGRAGAYNTYANTGLTPSPISSASKEAIDAAANPTPGDWLFFVKCQNDGTSCFAKTLPEHRKNVKSAQDRGVY